MKKYRLAVDVDEVLADTHAALAAWYRDTHGYCWSAEQLARTPLPSLVSAEHARGLEEMLHEGEIFRHLNVMPGSQLALDRLMGRFEIFIVTAAMEYPASCAAKYAWLQEHFPFIHPLNIVFCGDKSIVSADLLVDDCARHFTHFGGQGFCSTRPTIVR